MSLAVHATRSAAWLLSVGLAARMVGLVGTLLLVRYVTPGEYGEATAAAVIIGTAATLAAPGIGQFVLVKGGGRRDLAFHATVLQICFGLVSGALVIAFGPTLGAWFNAPGLVRYLPLLAVSMLLDRLWFVPERILVREMRFRNLSMSRAAGEVSYTAVSLATAVLGWGGMSIVAGNLARSSVRAAVTIGSVRRRDWLELGPLRREALLSIFYFATPLAVAALAGYATTKWDNLLVSRFFGPAVMAAYNLAYNLAGMAPNLVVDQVVDVLVPSFTRVADERRRDALVRGAGLLALVAMPLGVGMSALSHTLVTALFSEKWASVAPMLGILSLGVAVAPLGALLATYLSAAARTRLVMVVHLFALVSVMAGIMTIGRIDPLWTCAAVVAAGMLTVAFAAVMVRAMDPVPLGRILLTQVGPLLACLPMVAAVLGVRWALARAGFHVPYLNLVAEVALGGVAYVAAALLVARSYSRDFLHLIRAALGRRGGADVDIVLP